MKGSVGKETMCNANKDGWTKRWTAATARQNLWGTRPILGKGWDTEEDTNRGRDVRCSQTGRINTANMITPPTATYNLQDQCYPYESISGIVYRTRTNNSKVYVKTQRPLKSQDKLEKGEQSWRYHTAWFKTILQSYSNQNRMVLAQTQTHRSTD